jgi:hypothetical protein
MYLLCTQDALAALKQGESGGDSQGALKGILTHSLKGSDIQVSMFLDVATVLRGQPLDRAMAVWKAWHGRPARTCFVELETRCLLGVEEGRLVMHDVLAALGRGLILQKTAGFEEFYGSRVWMEGGHVVGCTEVCDHRCLHCLLRLG